MKPDLYTKIVLTVIAVLLAVAVLRPLVNTEITVSAQGPLSSMQMSVGETPNSTDYIFWVGKTGDGWRYNNPNTAANNLVLEDHWRIEKMGDKLAKK